jgi:hypothetical protein
LYNIIRNKGETIAKVMKTSPPTITSRRDLIGPRLAAWNEFLQRSASVLTHGSDDFRWDLTKNGEFWWDP